MSGTSEAMTNQEPFTLNSPPVMNPAASQSSQLEQQMQMIFNTPDGGAGGFRQVTSSPPPYQSITTQSISAGAATTVISNSNSIDQKRKRGRPRKYGPDGSMTIPMASPQQPINVAIPQQQQQQPQTFSPATAPPSAVQTETNPPVDGSVSPSFKKARGRPRGSKNKKQHNKALGSNGIGFVPHVLNVDQGEDFSSKIMAICQNGPRAVCVLSANGTIGTVTLRQPAASGGTATYNGRFDILSLSGSFMLTEVGGQKSRTGGLSVALAAPDGNVLGGSVAGLLVAASPAQVIVGSFMPENQKEVSTNDVDPVSGPVKVNAGGAAGASSSPSRGTLSESSGGPASPLMSSGPFNNMPQSLPWK